ncbi:MAG TPA: hypothetical protein GX695_03375 [Acholeplasmataceae bacterium]|nr:hypothetical protein [Acholeplasmataceae bacterium]
MNNRKSIFATLREHKNNQTSLIIMVGIILVNLIYNFFNYLDAYGLRIDIIFLLAPIIIFGGFALYYEKNKLSFVAHLILFIGLLEPYIREFYQMIFSVGSFGFSDFLIITIGAAMSIYTILKMIAHNNEIRTFIPRIKSNILFLLIIVLVNLYLLESLSHVLLFSLIMIAALFTSGAKMTLPVVLMIYIGRIVETVHFAYLLGGNLSNQRQINIIVNTIIYVFIIAYTVKLMREENNILYS